MEYFLMDAAPTAVNVMLDLETWGTAPGCAIRSVGAFQLAASVGAFQLAAPDDRLTELYPGAKELPEPLTAVRGIGRGRRDAECRRRTRTFCRAARTRATPGRGIC